MFKIRSTEIIMDDLISISSLNDFVFCPASIYFHKLYGSMDNVLYQNSYQLNGTKAHKTIDSNTYSTRKDMLVGIDVYCEHYNLIGKIDIYDKKKKMLIERKKHINKIYDGYVYQLYAQYFAMKEMGYEVDKLSFHSIDDNKNYAVEIPENDMEMFHKFENIIISIRTMNIDDFEQKNIDKCQKCIYEPACDRALNR